MDYRMKTTVTVQDCVQAISSLGVYNSGPSSYSAPLILAYKAKKSSSDRTVSGLRTGNVVKSRDIPKPRSQSVLGMRLAYQDYLMTEYLKSKSALASSLDEFQTQSDPLAEEYKKVEIPQKQFDGKNLRNKGNNRTPVYQNYFCDGETTKPSSSCNSPSAGVDEKKSAKPGHTQPPRWRSRQDTRRINRSAPPGTGSHKSPFCEPRNGQTLMFRYTKR